MHQEYSRKKKVSIIEIVIIGVLLFLLILGVNVFFYTRQVGSLYSDLLTIFIPLGLGIYLLKGYRRTYLYTIICEEFIVKQLKGKSETILLDININQIKEIRKGQLTRAQKKEYGNVQSFVVDGSQEDCYYCVYEEDENTRCFEIQASEKMINKLMRNNY